MAVVGSGVFNIVGALVAPDVVGGKVRVGAAVGSVEGKNVVLGYTLLKSETCSRGEACDQRRVSEPFLTCGREGIVFPDLGVKLKETFRVERDALQKHLLS